MSCGVVLAPGLDAMITSLCRYDPARFFFFFNDTATTEIYTLSLHDALPILAQMQEAETLTAQGDVPGTLAYIAPERLDRKSTRLNSSHGYISYAVFCLKKKKTKDFHTPCQYKTQTSSPTRGTRHTVIPTIFT